MRYYPYIGASSTSNLPSKIFESLSHSIKDEERQRKRKERKKGQRKLKWKKSDSKKFVLSR